MSKEDDQPIVENTVHKEESNLDDKRDEDKTMLKEDNQP